MSNSKFKMQKTDNKPNMKLELNERTARAVELVIRRQQVAKEIAAFVGEADLGWDDGLVKLREIATAGLTQAAREQLPDQQSKS